MTAQYRDSAAAADNDECRKVCRRKRLPQGFVQVGLLAFALSLNSPTPQGDYARQQTALARSVRALLPQEGLTAYQKVEDQSAALRILAGEAQYIADAVATAQQAEAMAEAIALNRYRNGLVSYLDVICVQTALLAKPGQHAPMKPAVLP